MAERWDEIKDRANAFREEHFGEKIESDNTSEGGDEQTEAPLNDHLEDSEHEALAADMAEEDTQMYGSERGTFGEQIGTETPTEDIDSDANYDTSAFETTEGEEYDYNR